MKSFAVYHVPLILTSSTPTRCTTPFYTATSSSWYSRVPWVLWFVSSLHRNRGTITVLEYRKCSQLTNRHYQHPLSSPTFSFDFSCDRALISAARRLFRLQSSYSRLFSAMKRQPGMHSSPGSFILDRLLCQSRWYWSCDEDCHPSDEVWARSYSPLWLSTGVAWISSRPSQWLRPGLAAKYNSTGIENREQV